MRPNAESKAVWILLQSLLISTSLAVPFCPPSQTVSTQLINRTKSASLLNTISIRGGSDRDYGYSDGSNRGRYDDGGRGGGNYNDDPYGDDRYGSQRGYDDDRYGSRQGGGYEDDYYGESQDYKERDYAPSSSKQYSKKPSPLANMPDVGGILRNGNKKIGLGLLGAGLVFTMLGISLFFNKTLIRLGNLFFIAGVPMTIGPGRTTGYFLQPKKSRATGCLALGIFLVFIGWPIFGIALEVFGLLNLFGNMFPVFMIVLKQMPFVGNLLNGNGSGKKAAKKNNRQAPSKDKYSYDDNDEYYEEDRGQEDGYSERSGYY